jgi:glycosyltransferase involved in cell wall biosynthesis
MSLILHAPNVHHGGGRALLTALLDAMPQRGGLALLDRRLEPDRPLPSHLEILRFQPSLRGRLAAELSLARRARTSDHVLCFGNLPPLLPVHSQVSVFVQNRYLVAPIALDALAPKVRRRILLERLWLRHGLRGAQVLVQTPSMAIDVQRFLGVTARVVPFMQANNATDEMKASPSLHDFIYVASGEPHKNHRCLIAAWVELARRDRFPSLCLTLDQQSNGPLLRWIDSQSHTHGLRVVNAGHVGGDAVGALYACSGALIYPSLVESFGLPLLEAQAAGLPIVAAERDYVRDVVTPTECFDPLSPLSMARAVLRHLKTPEPTVTPLSAQAFVAQLLLAKDAQEEATQDRTARS